MPHFSYSIIDYFQVEAIQFRGQGQRIWPNGSPWASVSEIVGQPDGLDGPSRRFCRLEFSPSATLQAQWAKVSLSPPAKTPADKLIQMVINASSQLQRLSGSEPQGLIRPGSFIN
jgi:hypothetical protein